MSTTTNTFQFGIKTENEWIGEDILILKDTPFPFSIIAKTKVVLLEISRNEMNKLQRDFLTSLENAAL